MRSTASESSSTPSGTSAPHPSNGPARDASSRRQLALDDLPPIDAVLLSHDHYDHLGANTVRQLARMESMAETPWITTLGVGKRLRRLGVNPALIRELDWTEHANVGPVELTALPARHFSGRGIFDRFKTLWASFVLAGPKHRVYYGADSGEWEGFAEIGREFGPFDLTMLEIGAFDPIVGDIHMGPDGAARASRALGDRRSRSNADPLGLFPIWPPPLAAADRDYRRSRRPQTLVTHARHTHRGRPREELRSDWWR